MQDINEFKCVNKWGDILKDIKEFKFVNKLRAELTLLHEDYLKVKNIPNYYFINIIRILEKHNMYEEYINKGDVFSDLVFSFNGASDSETIGKLFDCLNDYIKFDVDFYHNYLEDVKRKLDAVLEKENNSNENNGK